MKSRATAVATGPNAVPQLHHFGNQPLAIPLELTPCRFSDKVTTLLVVEYISLQET